MSFISTDEDESVLILKPSEFPSYYVDFLHPEDYKITNTPFIEKIFHKKKYHNRLLIRICFKIDINTYLPVTFVIDTGFPMNLYLCPKTRENIEHLIKTDEFDTEYITVFGTKNLTVDETPHVHHNVNIIGLIALNYLGFVLADGEFGFYKEFDYF